MSKLKITYFDMHGGRAEPARLALEIGGIEFEDERISFKEFGEMRSGTPFNSVPTMEIDGRLVTQSNAINRYVGKLTGLYPDDPLQALLCDEAMDAVEDVMHHIVHTFGLKGDALKAAREELVNGPMTVYLRGLNNRLELAGGEYFADGRLTIADLKVFVWISSLRKGTLDHVPADLPDRIAPLLTAHMERIANDDRVPKR